MRGGERGEQGGGIVCTEERMGWKKDVAGDEVRPKIAFLFLDTEKDI